MDILLVYLTKKKKVSTRNGLALLLWSGLFSGVNISEANKLSKIFMCYLSAALLPYPKPFSVLSPVPQLVCC